MTNQVAKIRINKLTAGTISPVAFKQLFYHITSRISMFALVNIKELYRNFLVQLQKIYSLSEATAITDWVFEKTVSLKRTDILKNPSKEITVAANKRIQKTLQELLLHKPVQYVLGEAWFYHMKLKVNSQVLIPRPETEELVEQLIKDRKSKLTDPAILDIGTGSGCIPIAIKKNLPASIVTGIDISTQALALARENAKLHNAHIQFKQVDFLDEKAWATLPLYDVIISNPPYIPIKEKSKLARHVTDFEPHLALFVPNQSPLIFYEKIALFAKDHLLPNGKIYLETHEDHAKQTAALFRDHYQTVMVKKDMYGNERMVIITA
ncbi:MAG: peptide chain release factor N(5)-glutamine methyltransferase [Chitinophagaceae bacterium]|nr:peptide chain release factor N(5)-glutamine methyltransferase [Chitinophagaceae bacterium]